MCVCVCGGGGGLDSKNIKIKWPCHLRIPQMLMYLGLVIMLVTHYNIY